MQTAAPNEPFRFSTDHAVGRERNTRGEDLVQETRREIQRLVREASELVGASKDADEFWPLFLDRVQRATAAKSVDLWSRVGDGYAVSHQAGPKLGNHLDDQAQKSHSQLIDEVSVRGEPVLVPPTDDWQEAQAAANPTEHLAVLVPVLVDGVSEAVLEVFMPTGGGPAAQRGYLRFAAQMGDLAGEFMRAEALRSSRRSEQAWKAFEAACTRLHQSHDTADVSACIVDTASELFAVDRVSLVAKRGAKWQVLSISGVPDFDDRAPLVKSLAEYVQRRQEHQRDARWLSEELEDDDPLMVAGLLELDDQSMLLIQAAEPRVDESDRQRWLSFAEHSRIAWHNSHRFDSIPLADLQRTLFAAGDSLNASSRPKVIALTIMALVVLAGFIPVPMVVSADAQLEPLSRQIVYAPRDAIVAEVLVSHDQSVHAGDPLLRLIDEQLESEIDHLIGEQNILTERHRELRSLMVSIQGNSNEEIARIEGDYKIVEQQIEGADRQLELMNEQREKLVVRAKQSGIVHGWLMEDQLNDRPVERGQELLQIVDTDGGWSLRAGISQERLNHVIDAKSECEEAVNVDVVFRSFPSQTIPGQLKRLGPVAVSRGPDAPQGLAEIQVDSSDLPIREKGATATVAIPCGFKPLAYVAFQDLIRSVASAVRIYI